jgi:hypothetical protein
MTQLGATTTLNISAFDDAESAVAVSPPSVPGASGPLSPVSDVTRPDPEPLEDALTVIPAGGTIAVVADDFSPQ